MKVTLRERDLNVVRAKLVLDCPQVGGFGPVRTRHQIGANPYDQFEIEAAVTESDQPDVRFPARIQYGSFDPARSAAALTRSLSEP